MQRSRTRRVAAIAVVLATGLAALLVIPGTGGAATPGTVTASNGTITVAGMGNKATFGDAATGAQARFQRANQTKEVKGYTFDFKEFADDKNDPATALSESRRLVAEDNIFALVPNVSTVTPGDYLTQQQIPWFGPGYDATYCPPSGKGGWGFSAYGCLLPEKPTKLPGPNVELLLKELQSKGIKQPTVAMLGSDQESGKKGIQNSASVWEGVGFKVVYAKGSFPAPPAVVNDYAPYGQALLTSNNGQQPDVVYTTITPQSSVALINYLKANGYKGTVLSPFYTTILLKPLTGAYVFLQFAGYESTAKGVQQMKSDVQAFKPGAGYTLTLAAGYWGADIFIQAVKAALRTSKTLTTAGVQKAASKMTYVVKDTIGPVKYPNSYKYSVKACATLEYDADGTAFTIAQPYYCTTKTYPILPKYANG